MQCAMPQEESEYVKIVPDTSVLYKLYVVELESARAAEIVSAVMAGQLEAHVPTLARYELLSAVTKGLKTVADVEDHLRHFDDLLFDGSLTEREPALDRLWATNKLDFLDTNSKGLISSYDTRFHALAIEVGATFVVADRYRIQRIENLVGNITAGDVGRHPFGSQSPNESH